MAQQTKSLLILVIGLSLAGCGQRNRLPPADRDGAPPADGLVPKLDGGGPKTDACSRPPGYCHSNSECKPGYHCIGCHADPCCPMCAVCYGICQPKTPGACSSNNDCQAGSYCHIDSGCGNVGLCKPRPRGCYSLYKPVCGCDGKTYSNDCVAWSNGVSIKYTGACSAHKCQDLFNDYAATVKKAKVCCPMCNSIQCQKKIEHQLACACPTYVQATNTVALQQLALYQKEWNNLACGKGWACPGTPCPTVNVAACVPDAVGSGICKDLSTSPP